MKVGTRLLGTLLAPFLVALLSQTVRAEDYSIEVLERPANGQFDPTNRRGRYKFRIQIHPNSQLGSIDGHGKICVADTARFQWALGSAPQVAPLQSRTDSKTVEALVKATGDWTGPGNLFFSVALPGFDCASNGLSPLGHSNRAQESMRLTPVLNSPAAPLNSGSLPGGPTASLPPYRLKVEPSSNATPTTDIRLRAEPTGTGGSAICKFEAIPTSGGSAWTNSSGNCGEVTTRLTAGTYTLRLTNRVSRANGGFEDLTEEKRAYVVSAPPNYTIPILATELLKSGASYRSLGRNLDPWVGCDELTTYFNLTDQTAIFGLKCGQARRTGMKIAVWLYENFKLHNGWKIKRVQYKAENSNGGYSWLGKPQEGSDVVNLGVTTWLDPHVGTLVDPPYKFIKVEVKVWIEGPSHLSPFKANEPRQSQ